jgi:hypothetical protein
MIEREARAYVDFTEVDNLIDNLEMAAWFLEDHPSRIPWKWPILGIFQALYGCLIAVLKGSEYRLTVYDTSSDRTKAYILASHGVTHEVIAKALRVNRRKVREWVVSPRLIGLHTALDRVQKKKHLPPRTNPMPLKLSEGEKESILKLTSWRNQFEHLEPVTWSEDWGQVPSVFKDVLRVIRFLALDSEYVNCSAEENTEIAEAIDRLERAIGGAS